MEDSPAMTIQLLRAQLLSERLVSKATRQRADELARRVIELEEQLKVVSLQRKKAEKATAEVLAILENHGMNDSSEAFDSSSDNERTHGESKVGKINSTNEEDSSVNSKERRTETDEFSGSEHESCSSRPGRSLSWKSGKDSPNSTDNKKFNESSNRRRYSITLNNSSSPKHHLGKSCRQIRRGETRSVKPEINADSHMLLAKEKGVPNSSCSCSQCGPEILRQNSKNGKVKDLMEGLTSPSYQTNGHEREKDMERALEQQAQLIGRDEEQEMAQREWEEKFKETNGGMLDSFQRGTYSDMTEEKESQSQKAKLEIEGQPFTNETSKLIHPNGLEQPSLDSVSPSSGLASSGQEKLPNAVAQPPLAKTSQKEASSNSQNEQYALIPHDSSDGLSGVLEALQRARVSLKQEVNRLAIVETSGFIGIPIGPSFPVGNTGLFRVPTDFKFEATSPVNFSGLNSQSSLPNYRRTTGDPYTENRSRFSPYDKSLSNPAVVAETRISTQKPSYDPYFDMALPSSSRYKLSTYPDLMLRNQSGNEVPFSPLPSRTIGLPSGDPYTGNRSSTSPYDIYLSSPSVVTETTRTSAEKPSYDPYFDMALPSSSRYIYPTYLSHLDFTSRIPSGDEISSPLPSRISGLPPSDNFSFGDRIRQNIYR